MYGSIAGKVAWKKVSDDSVTVLGRPVFTSMPSTVTPGLFQSISRPRRLLFSTPEYSPTAFVSLMI